MKAKTISLVLSVSAMVASADYKVINLVDGTNEVNVSGAVLPIAIEVKSTESNKLVKVDRASDVDILRKCYDITTNAHHWTEIQITTNDYFRVDEGSLKVGETSSYDIGYIGGGVSGRVFSDGRNVLFSYLESSTTRGFCYTNCNLQTTPVGMVFTGLSGNHSVGNYCSDGSVYVAASTKGLWWSEDGHTWTLGQPGSFSLCVVGGGCFVGFGTSGIYRSVNGKTWTQTDTDEIYGGCYGSGKFVVSKKNQYGDTDYVIKTSNDGITWASQTNVVMAFEFCHGNGMFVFQGSDKRLYRSTDAVTWKASDSASSVNFFDISYCDVKKCFYMCSYSDDKVQVNYVTKDCNSFAKLASKTKSVFLSDEDNMYGINEVTDSNNRVVRFSKDSTTTFSHESGSVGSVETWRSPTNETISYNPSTWGANGYWKYTAALGDSYSTEASQRPGSLTFGYPSSLVPTFANLVYSRATNNVPHVDYEYVTNRVWNVVDHHVTKIANIINAQCVEGISSQEITNRVFLVNGDKLVIDGVKVSDVESTKATLICE